MLLSHSSVILKMNSFTAGRQILMFSINYNSHLVYLINLNIRRSYTICMDNA